MSDVLELKRDRNGHYRAGNPPGPGRPKGSKNRLGQQFMKDLQVLWQEEGPEILRLAARQQPASFFRSLVIMLKPTTRNMDIPETTGFEDLQTPEDIHAAIEAEYGTTVADAVVKIGRKPMKVLESTTEARASRLLAKRK